MEDADPAAFDLAVPAQSDPGPAPKVPPPAHEAICARDARGWFRRKSRFHIIKAEIRPRAPVAMAAAPAFPVGSGFRRLHVAVV